MTDLKSIIDIIASVGFPVFLIIWYLWKEKPRNEQKIEEMIKSFSHHEKYMKLALDNSNMLKLILESNKSIHDKMTEYIIEKRKQD